MQNSLKILTLVIVIAFFFIGCKQKTQTDNSVPADTIISEDNATPAPPTNSAVKLIKSVEIEQLQNSQTINHTLQVFYYDEKNRFTKVEEYEYGTEDVRLTYEFTYKGDFLVYFIDDWSEFTAEKKGNIVHAQDMDNSYTITLNPDNTMAKADIVSEPGPVTSLNEYSYTNGNLVKETKKSADSHSSGTSVRTYSYDTNHSPLLNCATDKWFLPHRFSEFGFVNNITKSEWQIDGKPFLTTTSTYEYDADGYPSKITSITKDHRDSSEETVIRKIEYVGKM